MHHRYNSNGPFSVNIIQSILVLAAPPDGLAKCNMLTITKEFGLCLLLPLLGAGTPFTR